LGSFGPKLRARDIRFAKKNTGDFQCQNAPKFDARYCTHWQKANNAEAIEDQRASINHQSPKQPKAMRPATLAGSGHGFESGTGDARACNP
jgi:hypothetical protein